MTSSHNIPHLANPAALVKSMGKLHRRLVDDLRTRATDPRVEPSLREAWTDDKSQGRTGESFETYRDAFCDQAGASWILCTIFARTLEDRGYIPHRLAGPGAIERQSLFRSAFKFLGERDYLLHIFDGISLLPGAGEVFGRENAPLWRLGPTNRALAELLDELRALENGHLTFTFGRPPAQYDHNSDQAGSSTRYLGDLYQDLNEDVRKRYALLQTPDFVERFLLDNTLDPALRERGASVTVLDPACGSGHLLLGAYDRLFAKIRHDLPALPKHEAAKVALSQIYGIDLNPYAASVARFRLLLSYLDKAEIPRLQETPENIPLQIYVGDSLLAGRKELQRGLGDLFAEPTTFGRTAVYSLFSSEADKLLYTTKFDVIVANPPYITEKDAAKRDTIRKQYISASGGFSLAAPFVERIFQLGNPGAYTGQITANSFMKREFGAALVEKVLPLWDLGHVIDTSGAFIPGHGTPTVLLFGRSQKPISKMVSIVMGTRGEPSTPEDAAHGKVWLSITEHHNEMGFENEFISVAEVDREKLGKHPWSIGGGGASELKDLLEERAAKKLDDAVDVIGFVCMTRADDIYFTPRYALRNAGVKPEHIVENVEGEVVRDWALHNPATTLFPYGKNLEPVLYPDAPAVHQFLWPHRTALWLRREPNGNHREIGKTWWEWSRFQRERFLAPMLITFAFVATHNHFVLDRGGKVFNRTAPIIKLPDGATEDEHLALLGYLNSSTACFWMKQVMMNKGATSDKGVLQADPEKFRFEFDGTKLRLLPIPAGTWPSGIHAITSALDQAGAILSINEYTQLLMDASPINATELRNGVTALTAKRDALADRMVGLQEELDWLIYELVGLLPKGHAAGSPAINGNLSEVQPISADMRAYRFKALGVPAPDDGPLILKERLNLINTDPSIGLLEVPEYKRRWYRSQGKFSAEMVTEEDAVQESFKTFLLTRAEAFFQSREPRPLPIRTIADELNRDPKIRAVAEVLTGSASFDLETLLADLFTQDAVPSATSQVYTDEGIENRRAWERVWDLQRLEDARKPDDPEIKIDPPPKYDQKDFENAATLWRLRGKLDVPKERFIAYPTATPPPGASGKPGLVFGWAGWDTLQKLQATIELWQEEIGLHGFEIIPRATREQIFESDPMDERLMRDFAARSHLLPLLQTMVDLLPWVKQWHDEDGQTASAFEAYIADEARKMDTTLDEAHAYRRPAKGSVPKTRRAGTAAKAVVDGMTPAAEKKPRKARAKKE